MNNNITINDISNYNMRIIDGNLILSPINKIPNLLHIIENPILLPVNYITEKELFNLDLTKSVIAECKINNENIKIKKYQKLLVFIYSTIDKTTIVKNTTLNVLETEKRDKGFKYYKCFELSIQGNNSKNTLFEVINISKIKKYKLEIKIKLFNGEIIYFQL